VLTGESACEFGDVALVMAARVPVEEKDSHPRRLYLAFARGRRFYSVG